MSNIYFMCENCGIETNGITFVNGMKFCAKCYHQIFGKDNQQTEIDQLKQQLAEKDEQIKKRVMVYEKQFIEQTDEIYSLKQQLAEKQNTIDEINKEFVQAVHDWKTLCAEKDKEIKRVTKIDNKTFLFETYEKPLREQIQQLKQQLAEKEKKIEFIKHLGNHKTTTEMFKENAKLIIEKRQLAIQELEKVKMLTEWKFESIADVVNQIDQQIKELKGEKDDG